MPNPAASPKLPHHLKAQKTIRRNYSRRDFLSPEAGPDTYRSQPDVEEWEDLEAMEALDADVDGAVPVLETSQEERPFRVPASIGPYPIHSMLVPIAIGNFFFSFASDIVYLITGQQHPWNALAFYTLVAGTLVAMVAAIPGLLDFSSLPEGRARGIARIHMRINLVVIFVYIVNGFIRYTGPASLEWPIFFSTVTIMMLAVSAWLGAKLVGQLGVGLDPTGAEMAQDEMMRDEPSHARRQPRLP